LILSLRPCFMPIIYDGALVQIMFVRTNFIFQFVFLHYAMVLGFIEFKVGSLLASDAGDVVLGPHIKYGKLKIIFLAESAFAIILRQPASLVRFLDERESCKCKARDESVVKSEIVSDASLIGIVLICLSLCSWRICMWKVQLGRE